MNTNSKSRNRLGAGALATGIMAAATLQAGAMTILVANQSFENFTAPNGIPKADDWSDGFSDSASGYSPISAPAAGNRFMTLSTSYGVISSAQDTAHVVSSAGETFTLTVAIGRPTNLTLTNADYVGLVNLQLGSDTVATNTILTTGSPASGAWATATTTYTTTALDIGEIVGIELGGDAYTDPSRRRYFDNVTLDVESIPEPTTGGLILGSIVMSLAYRKRSTR